MSFVVALFDFSATILEPWAYAGFDVISVCDIDSPAALPNHSHLTVDIMTLPDSWCAGAYAVFAFPPCTHVAGSGIHNYTSGKKRRSLMYEGVEVFMKAIALCKGSGTKRWFAENPVSIMSTIYRKPDYYFDPADYAGYLDDETDNYIKKTCLWTGEDYVMPEPKPLPNPPRKDFVMAKGGGDGLARSLTPRGFTLANYEANKPETPNDPQ